MKKFLLLFLLIPSLCFGAIAEVASRRATQTSLTAASDTLAFPNNVTSGNLLIIAGTVWDTDGAIAGATVSDSVGTTYTKKFCTEVPTASGAVPFIMYGIAAGSGANTVTLDPDGGTNSFSYSIDEFSGVDTGSPLDVDGGSSTGSGSGTGSDAITTGVANALIIGVIGWTGADGFTPGGSYTEFGTDETTLDAHSAVFRIATTATSYTVDWSSVNVDWSACTLSFKPSSSRRPVAPMVLQ